jgi:hypothetical protein
VSQLPRQQPSMSHVDEIVALPLSLARTRFFRKKKKRKKRKKTENGFFLEFTRIKNTTNNQLQLENFGRTAYHFHARLRFVL